MTESKNRNNWWKGPQCEGTTVDKRRCQNVGYTIIDGKHYCARHAAQARREANVKRVH